MQILSLGSATDTQLSGLSSSASATGQQNGVIHRQNSEQTTFMIDGRGMDALGIAEGVPTRPPVTMQLARVVKASDIRVIVSKEALQQQQIPSPSWDPTATDMVDNTAVLMAELVSRGHQVTRY
jgi:hypothetical protein